MRELRTWAKILPPPGIMYEEAAPVVENRIMNRRIWIPERRAWRVSRFEQIWRLAILHRPVTRQNWTFHSSRSDIEGFHQFTVLIEAHCLLNRRNHDDRPGDMVMIDHLLVSGMRLVIWGLIAIICLHHVQVEELIILIIYHRLEILGGIGPTKFPVQPVTNAIGRVSCIENVVMTIDLIMIEVRLPPRLGFAIE